MDRQINRNKRHPEAPDQNTLTGWVPVFGNPPRQGASTASNTLGPILGMIVCFSLLLFAIAWSFGLLESPNRKLANQSQDLSEELATTQAELDAIRQCVGGSQ